MNNIERCKNVVNYYVLCTKLKDVIRTGWKTWSVKRERLESVAEHVFGVQTLAIAMYSEFEYDIDIRKVLFMLAVHELEETIIGDLTHWDITPEEKMNKGHEAVEQILSNLLSGNMIKELIYEFDERKTKEAVFAYHCDKLECDLQCKLYDEEKCVDMSNQSNNYVYRNYEIQNLINDSDNSWSNMWLTYDRSKFLDDDNFVKVLDYVKDNKIKGDS